MVGILGYTYNHYVVTKDFVNADRNYFCIDFAKS